MKIFVNKPDIEDKCVELEDRVAEFHATLLIEKIKQLSITDTSKKELLKKILDKLSN